MNIEFANMFTWTYFVETCFGLNVNAALDIHYALIQAVTVR